MINPESVKQAILKALYKAEQEGQPVAELLDAVAQGATVDAWFEPADDGKCSLIITAQQTNE